MPVVILLLLCLSSVAAASLPIKADDAPLTITLHPGQSNDSAYEQETYECARTLKHELQQRFPSVDFVVSRGKYEKIEQEEIASYTNRLGSKLFISMHLCTGTPCQVQVYSYVHNPTTDYWQTDHQVLTLLPANKAYLVHAPASKELSQKIVKSLKASLPTSTIQPACGLPFKPLEGVACPACAFELSLVKPKEWRLMLPALVEAVGECITSLKNKR